MARERKIEGVLVAKVVESVLDRSLVDKKLGLAGALEQKIARLAEHIKATFDASNQLRCTTCGAEQDLTYPRCPFCGVSGLQDAGHQRDWETIDYHPAALMFPEASEEEMASLEESIRAGFDKNQPIILYQGQILDGRNRHLTCVKLGIEPNFVELSSEADPFQASWIFNGARRSIAPDVRAAIFIRIVEASNGWRARGKSKSQKHRSDGTFMSPDVTNDNVAERAGVSLRTVERVLELKNKAPEAFERVATGRTTANRELGKIKKEEEARARANNPANDAGENAPVEERISVALMHRINSVPLYARPKGRSGHEGPPIPATTLVEDPYGELELSHDVVLVFSLIRNGAGELVLNVEPRRKAEWPEEAESGVFRTAPRVA